MMIGPTPTPTPIPIFAPGDKPEGGGDPEAPPDPGLPAAGAAPLGLIGNEVTPPVADAAVDPLEPDPGAAPGDVVVGPELDAVILGRSEAWKLIWMRGAKRT